MTRIIGEMPAYTYGTAAVATSRVSLKELEELKVSVGFTARGRALPSQGRGCRCQPAEIVAHWRSGIIHIPNLAATRELPLANRSRIPCSEQSAFRAMDSGYLPASLRSGLAELSAGNRPQAYEPEEEPGRWRRVHPACPVPDIAAFVAGLNDTIKPYLANAGAPDEEVDAMHRAWCRSLQLQIALWARLYMISPKRKTSGNPVECPWKRLVWRRMPLR